MSETANAVASYLQSRQPEEAVRATLSLAAGSNPDAEAEFARLSREAGIPIDSVRDNKDAVQQRLAMPDPVELATKFPGTTKYLSKLDNARIAHDDVGNLTAIEKSFREAQGAGRAVRGKVDEPYSRPGDQRTSSGRVGETFTRRGSMTGEERSFLGGITEPVKRGLAQGDRGLTILLSELGVLNSGKSDLGVTLANQQRQVERYPVPPKVQEAMAAISGAETMGDAASQILRNPRAVLEVSLQSLGASAPALVGAAAGSTFGPLGTAAGAGTGSFAVEYAATIQEVLTEKGVDGKDAFAVSSALNNPEMMAAAREKAVKRGIPIAIFDALTAGIAGRILAGAKGTVTSAGTRAVGELAVQAGGGAAGEAVAQAVTDEYKPGDILLEALAEMPSAFVEVPANFRHAREKAQRAEEIAVGAEKLTQLADASKLRQRDPESFKQFLADVAGDGEVPSEFFIDAEQLANSLNQSAVTIEQLRAFAPAVAQQLEASNFLPGADIRVPVAEFAAADPKIAATLIEHLREAPDAMSRAEAQAFMQEQGKRIEQDVTAAVTGEAAQVARKEAANAARAVFEEQLNATGKFRPEVNKAYATLLGDFYATQAERSGMTVDEFMDRYHLRITKKDGGGQQRLEQAQLSRGEGGTSTAEAMRTELRARFGDIVDKLEQRGVLNLWDGFDAFNQAPGQMSQLAEGLRGAQGMFLNGAAHLFGDGVMPGNVVPVFLHEVGEHASMKAMLGERYKVLVKRAYALAKQGDPIAVQALMRIPDNTPKKFMDSEMVAYLIEEAAGREDASEGVKQWLLDVIAAVKAFLFEKGLDIELSPQDIAALAVRAVQFQARQEGRVAGGEVDIALSQANTVNQGEGRPRGSLSFGNDITSVPSIIALMEGADLSTFLHESGHLFLEVQADLSSRILRRISSGQKVSESERQILADMEAILKWMGIAPQVIPASTSLESEVDRLQLDAKALANLPVGESGRAQLEGFGGVEALLAVLQRVAVAVRDDKVFDAVVRAIPVDVMDVLRAEQLPPDVLLDYPAVLKDRFTTDGALDVSIPVTVARALSAYVEAVAKVAAETPGVSDARLAAGESDAAAGAGQGGHGAIFERRTMEGKLLSRLDAWSLMSLDERREFHEQWARGFEKYLGEGRAPSQELQGLFSKFRSWLISVYKALAGLNVDLTDEVRQVMDRMLATDEAIEEAEAARNMGPLFESPEKAGMTPAAYADYQKLGERQSAEAAAQLDAKLLKDMRWLSRARAKALKQAQAEVDEVRKEVEREVRAQVMANPVYQVWQVLTGKGEVLMPGTGAVIRPESNIKLRTKLVKEISEEGWSRLSERRMTSEDRGWDPEIVAEAFGFTSADQLVQDLSRVPPPQQVIEEMTDRLMLERFGDIASQEALERAADEAVHNEVRARVVATELKALEKATSVRGGNRSTVDVMARAAKEYAYAAISALRVRDIRPSQYSAAAARNAKLAKEALGKSTEEAAMHLRNELINIQATKAAYEALDEVKALQKYMRKFDKRIDSIDPGYQDQIEQLLERFDFKPSSLKAIDKRKSFAAWYAEQEAAGNAPSVPDELLDEARRQSFKDMTVEELRGLRDTIKQIEHQGRLKKKLLLARDKRDFDAIATDMAASIIAHGGDARPVELEGPNPVMDWFAGAWASHRKLASLFRQMDGNNDAGPMWEYIGRSMNEQSTVEDVALEQATVKLRELYAPLLKMRGGITGYRSKVFIPEINASLTRGGRLAVALNWGNEANRQRIMDGDKWSVDQVQAILKTLSPVELDFVNKVWEFIDSYWPEIAAKEKRLTGVEPEKVEAAPFNVLLPDGTEVAMRGGYYPLKYDTDRSDRADQHEAAQVAKEMMQGVFSKATTRRGHTKERLKEVKRAVRKDLNVITQHVTQVVHDLAWHEWLIDTNKLLGDDRIVSTIRDHYGPKVLKTMRDDVLGIATADVVPMDNVDKTLLFLRGNVTRATMGASLTTAFLQPFGLTQSIVRIGGRHVLRGLARWGGDATRMENAIGWIHERSEFMRLRAKTFNRELREIRGSVQGKSATMRVIDAGLFVMMQKMQMVADVPTWLGQYEKSKSEGLSDADAIAMADRAVVESQGGGNTKDMAEVQRKHPMLTQFYSYFSVTLNLAAEQTAATDFKNPAAVAGWLGDMALLMVIPAILPSFILYSLRGGDDEDEKGMARRIVEWQVSYLLGTVVGLRELSGAVAGFDYAGPPVGRIISDTGKAGKQTAQGELDEPAVMAYINLMGTVFGIPVVQALRSYKGWKAWDEGQEGAGPQSVLLGPPPKD